MALAQSNHHAAPTGQNMARAGEGRSEQNHTAPIRETPPPPPPPLLQLDLFELSFDEEPGGARADRLSEVRPQEQVWRRTVHQIVDSVPVFPKLFREPQLAKQLVEVSTILCFIKQKVDIPVPGGGGRLTDLRRP